MKEQVLDYCLVPIGLIIMMVYNAWLLHKIIKQPSKTIIGIHSISRRFWVLAMMEDKKQNGVLAVQTLRNNIMASTLLASTAITLSSVIAILMTSQGSGQAIGHVLGDASAMTFSFKFFSIMVCFLLAFLLNVQSIRYYSHASILINVPLKKVDSPYLTADYVAGIVNKGGYFWSLGLRAFYFSLPLFLWIFGPIPMFSCCVGLVILFFFLDFTIEMRSVNDEEQAM
ncbi:hypothetical protein RND81_04G005000 [Saponaria officinalis]|uniref:DUF599 domain-containing protein n=1 Tax=Saponaria officinalis TaxID=3572 RepID=A0AAW1LGE9_SAPOF